VTLVLGLAIVIEEQHVVHGSHGLSKTGRVLSYRVHSTTKFSTQLSYCTIV
jgi:hypothetical protein